MENQLFVKNRLKLVSGMEDKSALLVFSLDSGHEKFIVNKNFYYATGDDEVDDILLIVKNGTKVNTTIFIHPYDELKAKWNGRTYYKEEIMEMTGITEVCYLSDFEASLSKALASVENLYLDLIRSNIRDFMTYEEGFAKKIVEKYPYIQIKNASYLFKSARTCKDTLEVAQIEKAISITNRGLEAIMTNLKPGMHEYQIESYFDQAIKFHGGTGIAFTTIAATGENATCLHYSSNNTQIKDGDLVLFDLGALYENYNADISRTFPANGKFTPRQKQLYNIVLEGQEVVFSHAKPGITTLELNQKLIAFYQKKLKEIGLIKEDSEVQKYYYHGVSHHLGLDVHDLCEYTPLKPGCVITNEPGLYIKEEGIGIRIEDDVLITEDGCVNLSKGIIKTVEEIEEFMEKNNLKK